MAERAEELAAHQHGIGHLIPFLDAMRSIAEIAWRRAIRRLDPLAVYRRGVQASLDGALSGLDDHTGAPFPGGATAGPVALLLITPERGLCGPFTSRLVELWPAVCPSTWWRRSGSQALLPRHSGPAPAGICRDESHYARPLPSLMALTYVAVEAIVLELLDLFDQGPFARLEVVRQRPTHRFQYETGVLPLLPPALDISQRRTKRARVLPTADAPALVTQLLTESVLSGLYQVVIESASASNWPACTPCDSPPNARTSYSTSSRWNTTPRYRRK